MKKNMKEYLKDPEVRDLQSEYDIKDEDLEALLEYFQSLGSLTEAIESIDGFIWSDNGHRVTGFHPFYEYYMNYPDKIAALVMKYQIKHLEKKVICN